MSEKKGKGGARRGAGRKAKDAYAIRQTGSWNVEKWIPKALQQLAKEKGLQSASDIVNEALKSLCFLFGKQSIEWSIGHPDPNKTARWRFFTDQELLAVVQALADQWKKEGNPSSGPLHDVWLSAWQALEPRKGENSWRKSILDERTAAPKPIPAPKEEPKSVYQEGLSLQELGDLLEQVDAMDQELTQEDFSSNP